MHLFIVPAQVAGTWRLGEGDLTLKQSFQMLTGTLSSGGKTRRSRRAGCNGDEISFAVGDANTPAGSTATP